MLDLVRVSLDSPKRNGKETAKMVLFTDSLKKTVNMFTICLQFCINFSLICNTKCYKGGRYGG